MRIFQKPFIFIVFILMSGLIFAVSLAQQSPNQFIGMIDDENPFIEIGFSVSNATTITIDLNAVSGDLDTYLFLVDNTGKIIAENDDRVRGDTNSSIAQFFIPTGDYTIIATRYDVLDGDSIGEYELNITYDAQTQERIVYDVSNEALKNMGFPDVQPRPKAEWTILVYYGGDSTLEASLMSDLVEFERAGGSTENTRIIALLDRYGLSDANGGWTGARLFEITQNVTGDFGKVPVPTIDSVALADLGAIDTGNGETLARFMTWGILNYPAENYVLAFGGHGGGWRGVITDDTSETIITLPHLDEALQTVKNATGIGQFDLLINDACLMGSIEYYDIMARHFDYSLASPEIVIDPALDMTLLTELIKSEADTKELGIPLVTTYIERDILVNDRPDSRYMTFASTQLNQMAELRLAVEAFARLVNQDPLMYAPLLGQARANAYTYAKFLGGENDFDVDLGHFMRQVIAYSADAPIINAARDVLKALENARLFGDAADYADLYTSYYSIYFPRKSKDFSTAYFNDSPLKQWAEMLANYYNSTMPRLWSVDDSVLTYHPPIRPEVTITTQYPTETANAQNPPVLGLQVVGRNLSQGQFTVDRITETGEKIRLMSTPILAEVAVGDQTDFLNVWKSGLDLSYFNWQPFSLPVVTDGIVSYNELLIKTSDLATLAGRFRVPNSENWVDVAVIFNPLGYVEQVIGRADVLGVVAPTTIPRGAEFQTYRYVVMSDGQIKAEAGNTYTWGEGGISFVDVPVPAGQYEMGFLVQTFSGINGFASTPLTVTVPDANRDNFVGYTDLELGINYQYPATWLPVNDRQDILYTTAPNEDTEIEVYAIPMDSDVYTIVDVFTQAYDARLFAPAQQLSVFDTDALQFDVLWNERAGWRGRAVALYHDTPQGKMALVFIVNGTDSDMITATFNDLRDSIRLFDSPPNLTTWHYERFPNGLAYPIPNNWLATEDGDWRVYTDPTSANTVVAIARMKADDQQILLNELIAMYASSASDLQKRTYFAEYRTWDVAGFTQTVNGELMAGRIYVAQIDNRVYAIRIQTPMTATAASLYRTIFEPLVDGFAPRLTVILSSGGLLSTYTKAALTQAQATCADMPFNTLCVGEGTVTTTYADPKVSSKRIDRAQDAYQSFDGLQSVDVGILADNTIDPLSVALFNIQANLPNNATDGLMMAAFGGVTIENRGGMNNFDVFMNGAPNDPNLVGGVLFITPPDRSVIVTINDVEFEVAPGAVFFWREANNDIENAIIENDRVGVVGLVAKRRPGSWSAQVMKGIVRARFQGSFGQQVATTVAGTSINFDGDLEIGRTETENQNFYDTLISFKPDIIIDPPIDDDTLDKIIDNQDILNDVDLNNDDLNLLDLLDDGIINDSVVPTDDLLITENTPESTETPIGTETPPLPPTYSLTAFDVDCFFEGSGESSFVTYTASDGATLVSASLTTSISANVKTVLPTQIEIEFLCPATGSSFPITVDAVDSLGRNVTTTFTVNSLSESTAPELVGTTVYNCLVGDNVVAIFDYVTTDGSSLDSVVAGTASSAISVAYATVLNATQLEVSVDCLAVGSGTADMIVYTNSPGYPELSLTINFTVVSTVTFTASPLVCNVGDNTTITASLVGSDIGSLSSLSFGNPSLVTFSMGTETIIGGNISIPVTCVATGSTTYAIFVIDLDTNVFNDSANATVNPAVPTGTLTVSDASCTVGNTTLVTVTYTNATFPARTISSVPNSSSSNSNMIVIATTFAPGVTTYQLTVNCIGAGTSNITVNILDSNNDAYSDVGVVTADPSASPPYFSGGTSHNCVQGSQVVVQFEYIENEPGTPTLTGASANTSGAVSVQAGNINLINGNMWVEVVVDCDSVGSGTLDILAGTTSGLYPNVSLTGISFTVNPAPPVPTLTASSLTCSVGQVVNLDFTYNPLDSSGLTGFFSHSFSNGNLSIGSTGIISNTLRMPLACNFAGTTNVTATVTTTSIYGNITSPPVLVTINPASGTPYITMLPTNIVCNQGQQVIVTYLYHANGGENLGFFNAPIIVNTANANIAGVNPSGNYLDVTVNCLLTGTTFLVVDARSTPSSILISAPNVTVTVNP